MSDELPSDAVLNTIDKFVSEIAYAPDPVRWAIVLQLAVGHAGNETFPTRGHVLVTGKKPKSGKTTLSNDVPNLLGFNPWKVSKKTTDPAMMHKFFEEDGSVWLLDDVSKIFGEDGNSGKTSSLYSIACEGYRNDAIVSMSRGSVTRDVPAYVQMWFNGLHKAVPTDLATRSIRAIAVPRPKNVKLRSALHPDTKVEAEGLRKLLHVWVSQNKEEMRWFALNRAEGLHVKLVDRAAQIWGPMAAVANSAGGEWPRRFMTAFVTLELDATDQPLITPDMQLTLDVANVCKAYHVQRVFTADLVDELRNVPMRPYEEYSDGRMLELLDGVMGTPSQLRGKTLLGDEATGEGWLTQRVYKDAAEIHKIAYPVQPAPGPTKAEQRLKLTKIGA